MSKVAWRRTTSRAFILGVVALVIVGALSLFSSAATPNAAALKLLREADAARALAASAIAAPRADAAPAPAPILLAGNSARNAVQIDPIRNASTFSAAGTGSGVAPSAPDPDGALAADESVGQLDAAGFNEAAKPGEAGLKVEEAEKPAPPSSELINAGTYAFAALSGVPLEDMSSGTTVLVAADADDFASAVTPIGFEFWYDGVRQNLFSVNANGTMRLGVIPIGTAFSNSIASTTSQPQISPYWDDLWVGNNGRVHYKVVGSAPNRRLVVEWTGEQIPRVAAATSGAGTFQAWLFESTGLIEFVYGSGIAVNTTNGGYSVGLGTSATSIASVTTATSSVSYVTANNTQTTAIASGTAYTFTPNTPTADAGSLTFTAVGLNGMTLNWVDSSANEVGYAIYRSVDGVNYDFIRQTAAGVVSSTETGLASNTTWFWRVVTVTEGAVSAIVSGSQATTAGTVAGTISVGPTGLFSTIGAAVANINTNGLAGNVILELQTTYLSAVETFPLVINTLGSPSNTITIRPETIATALSITSANTTATLDLNTATNVTIDGRAGGTGPSQLTIANTATAGVAVRLINGASRNTIQFTTIQGVNSSTTGAVVLFSTTTGVTGNNQNAIDTCDVRDGATFPVNGILSVGTASTALLNTGNTVSNSNVFNFFSATAASSGIVVTTNTNVSNTGWAILGNRFFQTATRTYTAAQTHRGILINGGNDYIVRGNTVGFATSAGTGTYAMTGTVATSFIAIQQQVGGGTNSITGNTVAGISLQTTTGSLNGIVVTSGSTRISGNTVGSGTGNGSLSLADVTTSGAFLVGMNIQGSATGSVEITGNTIGSLTAAGVAATVNPNINVVQVVGGSPTITGNLLGSLTTPNSIQTTSAGTAATAQQIIGLFIGITMPSTISGNTVANVSNFGTGTAHVIRALQIQNSTVTAGAGAGNATISLNDIHDITGANANPTIFGGTAGMLHAGTSPLGATVERNTVSAISATNTGAVGTVAVGIGYTNASNGSVTRNRVCDVRNASTGTTATTPPMGVGILVQAALGTGVTVANNMVSLGDGQATNTQFVGIMQTFNTVALRSYFNTVHIMGTAGGGALPSYGFLRGDNTAASAIVTSVSVLDNIFDNDRTGGTGKHYAIGNVNTVPATGWGPGASDNNVLNSPVAGTVGIWGLALDQTFAQWQVSSGGDTSSLSGGDISYVGPCDVHINIGLTPTPIESHGVTIPGVAIDYDNETRPGPPGSVNGGGTAPDLGADEFDGVPGCTADAQCSDGNPCTDDTCNVGTGNCEYTNDNTNVCSDGNACTSDACVDGACIGTESVFCDDGNDCTDDTCNPATGLCVYVGNTDSCNDGNLCTTNDTCGSTLTTVFSESFDGVTAPALPAGWTSSQTGTGSFWVTTAASSHTAPNSAFGADGTTVSDELLISPPIPITSADAVLTFRNRWSFENGGPTPCYDGGVLEISINAGPFTDIVTAGGTFLSGGYTGTVSTGFTNPIGGRAAWCAVSAGYPAYLTSQVKLPASLNGQSIQLRWRIGTDTSAGAPGQNVDTITIANTSFVCIGGPPQDCDDDNPCTMDTCNPNPPPGSPDTGCVNTPIAEGGSCTDGDPCNGDETCDALGVCQPGTPIGCDDFNPCTDDACVTNVGCVYTNDDTNFCTDNDVCTTDSCVGGVCVAVPNFITGTGGGIAILDNQAGAPYPSTITIPPTTGSVVGVRVLLNGFTQTFPDDVDVLLVGPTGANAVILSDAGGSTPITGVNLALDDAAATAVPDSAALVSGTFKPFNHDTASDPFTGAPAHGTAAALSTFIGTDPSGAWSLYVWDDAGGDTGSFGSWELRIAVDCDDDNPCTDDSCDPILGCVHVNNTCDDGNPCTDDSCDPATGCVYTPVNCNDDNTCNGVETCDPELGCVPGTPPNCDDGLGCTLDSCNEQTDTCDHLPNDAVCSDCDACTVDRCDPSTQPVAAHLYGSGSGLPTSRFFEIVGFGGPTPSLSVIGDMQQLVGDVAVSDGGIVYAIHSPATIRTVNVATGALLPPVFVGSYDTGQNSLAWAPGNRLYTMGFQNGNIYEIDLDTSTVVLIATLPESGGDLAWDPVDGVLYAASRVERGLFRVEPCDGTFVRVGTLNLGGLAASIAVDGSGVMYATGGGSSDPAFRFYRVDKSNASVTLLADFSGVGVGAVGLGAAAATGCGSTPLDCNDDLYCNGGESCNHDDGCLAGTPPSCDDGIACTLDSCNEQTDSCDHTPSNAACDDGNACNGVETCDPASGCVAGTPPVCDDGNPCTDDVCDSILGCVFTPDDTNECSDGNACTEPDVCRAGACVCDNTGPCVPNAASYSDTTVQAIPTGPAVVTSTITVPAASDPFLNSIRLVTNITHINNADLDITLTSPAGTVVTITSDNGGTNDNVFNGTLWNDKADPGNQVPFPASTFAASRLVTDTVTANLVTFTPAVIEEALGAFYGEDPRGVWTLSISDDAALNGGSLAGWTIELSTLPAAPASTMTSITNSTSVALADSPAVTSSSIVVAGAGTSIARVRVATSITHTFPGDLDITLTSPLGTVVTITTDNAASNDNVFNGTMWDDKADPGNQVPFAANTFAASNIVTDTTYAIGVVKPTLVPEEAFAAFQGENPNGTWTLRSSDDAGGDTGTLSSWTLEITTAACSLPCVNDCDDGNPCTDDACDPDTGCVYTNNTAACSDGDPCTVNDVCGGGLCAGTPANCDDGNSCTDDACNPANGACVYTINDDPCDDGNLCTTGDTCGPVATTFLFENFDGVVSPALPAGWVSTQTPAAATPWTTNTAFPGSPPNSATTDTPTTISDKTLDSPAFIGGFGMVLTFTNRYNLEFSGTTYFDGAVLEIKIGAGPFTDIVTAGGSFGMGGYTGPISAGFSSPIAGRQAWSAASTAFVPTQVNLPASAAGQIVVLRWRVASDSSAAAAAPNGQWIDDVRVSGALAGCQGTPLACDDGNPCTVDSCDPATGCVNDAPAANGLACGDPSDTGCDNPDNCLNGACQANYEAPGFGCSDGNACTTTDACDGAGICVGGPAPNCDDGNPCTVDSCDPATGCVNDAPAANGFACGDPSDTGCDNPDSCLNGACQANYEAPGFGCSDGNACTTADACDGAGVCVGGPAPNCDDGNPCTVDSCDPATGCVNDAPAANGFACGDPSDTSCDNPDSCLNGACQANYEAPGFGCSDGNACTTADACDGAGVCVGGPALSCDDDNACNGVETCDPATGCVAGTPLMCSDGNACNGVDVCDPATGCVTFPPPNCNDGNACTTDSCNPATGCVNMPISCDDGNACTADSCSPASGCVNAPITCNDGNACNGVETCNPATGCVAGTPLTCNDGNACNGLETCNPATGCVAGTPVVCAPPSQCQTAGVCDPGTGACSYGNQPSGTPCDDGNSATAPDACDGNGVCVGESACTSTHNPRTVGFWRKVCRRGTFRGETIDDADAACVGQLSDTFGGFTTRAQVCNVLDGGHDHQDDFRRGNCSRAEDQLMALALNLCKERVCCDDGIDSRCDDNGHEDDLTFNHNNHGDDDDDDGHHDGDDDDDDDPSGDGSTVCASFNTADALLDDPSRTNHECQLAECLSKEINNGHSLEFATLVVRKDGANARLAWLSPVLNDGTARPDSYRIWRRDARSEAPFVQIGSTMSTEYLDITGGTGSWEYDVTAVLPDDEGDE